MGYFSNGTEGEIYKDNYCYNCKNWTEREGESGEGCPIWDMHLSDNNELCNSKDSNLNKLIPRVIKLVKIKGTDHEVNLPCNGKCVMFLP